MVRFVAGVPHVVGWLAGWWGLCTKATNTITWGWFSPGKITIVVVNQQPLFFGNRGREFYPTLKLLHQCISTHFCCFTNTRNSVAHASCHCECYCHRACNLFFVGACVFSPRSLHDAHSAGGQGCHSVCVERCQHYVPWLDVSGCQDGHRSACWHTSGKHSLQHNH